MKKAGALIATILLAVLSAACSNGGLQIDEAWARPAAAGGTSAVYFTINNPSAQDEVLLSASTDVAGQVEIHRSMQHDGGTMSMQPQENVPIPARSQVKFEPGGLHIMLVNLPQGLQVGDAFDLVLKFQNAGELKLTANVREP